MPTILPQPASPAHRERRLTGRVVLLSLVGFFLVVASANAVMITAAVTTFGGAKTDSSYRAGQRYAAEKAAADAQDALRWKVDTMILTTAATAESAAPERIITVTAVDASAQPLDGLAAVIRLEHPTDTRRDQVATTEATGAGSYRGTVPAAPGQWDLVVELSRDGETLFRSRQRVYVP